MEPEFCLQAFGIFLVFFRSYQLFLSMLYGVSDLCVCVFVWFLSFFFLLLIRNAGAHDTIECRYEGDEALEPCILDSFSPLLLLGLNEVFLIHCL